LVKKGRNVVIGICGGISIYKVCELVRILIKDSWQVKCLMTNEATKLIRPELFTYLSGNKVYTDIFAANNDYQPNHINIASWADKMIIAPATANMLAKLRAGLCDDIVSLTALSIKTGVLICPAMHENMYENKATRENIKILKKRGYIFSGPIRGKLLDNKTAMGHLQKIDKIYKDLKTGLK
jgi:phosphopantothenoylcysteine decarboxylase/phosphopantothenate--cysteine ligase